MREGLNYQTSGYVYCTKKTETWTWVKIQKKGSKYNSVVMVTDNLNWRLSAIKLHLAARAAIVYDFSSLPKLL